MTRKYVHKIILFSLLILSAFFSYFSLASAQDFWSEVPDEYYENYRIADDFNEMIETLSDLEATLKVWVEPWTELFATLNRNFAWVFDFFPKSPWNIQTYKQCEIITNKLAKKYTSQDYSTFKSKCFDEVRDIIWGKSAYTISPTIKAKPTKWPAPLTVTFDAKESSDPSLATIPEKNFFWYYKDINWVEVPMGIGPIVTHTFDRPGKYVIHSTVRSSNNIEQGIFDWSKTLEVTVDAKAADIVIYLNGKKLNPDRPIKIDSQEAKEWFVINGSATQARWERKIVQHSRKITWDQQQNRYQRTDTQEWPPWQFSRTFPQNGKYKIELEIIDNENNKLKETYEVSVSDPVALMRYTPAQWSTSTNFTFDGSASYSLTSRLVKYRWIVIDPTGEQIDFPETRSFQKKFRLPWTYTIQLTTIDELWNDSYDIQKIEVESTAPIAWFQITPLSNRKKPSQFTLDASGSFDEDVRNTVDELSYSWTFSNPWAVDIHNVSENWDKVVVTYNEVWDHKIKLTVRDKYGKSAEVEKPLSVESTLRPELFIEPITWVFWDTVRMIARNNKEIGYHFRDFGDGDTQSISSWSQTTHIYTEAWIFPVTLTVATLWDGEENSITRNVFMGQKDVPTIWYEVKSWADQFMQKNALCEGKQWQEDAYTVNRYENFQVSLASSINSKGKNTGLSFFITPEEDEKWKVYEKNSISYDFKELWCHYLDIEIQDKETGKSVQERLRFDVQNNLPELWNVVLSFPQSNQQGQWIGIGIWIKHTPQEQETFGIDKFDPLMVKVTASGVRDSDWRINWYRRYYYNTKNEQSDREQFWQTPSNVPYYTFTLPRIAWEYAFGVEITDDNGDVIDSIDLLWEWPIVTFTRQWNPNIPTLHVKVSWNGITTGKDALQVNSWDEVIFELDAEVASSRSDFETSRYFKIDLDGDGTYDTPAFKESEYRHIYDKAWEYVPKVKVVYRDKVWIDISPQIWVKQWARHSFITDQYDKYVLVRNTSVWWFDTQLLCTDTRWCPKWSENLIENPTSHIVTYPKAWEYQMRMISIDSYGNKPAPFTPGIEITTWSSIFKMLSLPQPISVWSGIEISVWDALDNTISFYPLYQWTWNCFVDINILEDTDGDEDPLFDQDVECNSVSEKQIINKKIWQRWNIYYIEKWVLQTIPLTITLLKTDEPNGFEIPIPSELQDSYNRLEDLISDVENGTVPNDDYYYVLLEALRDSISLPEERSSVLLQLHEYIQNSSLELPAEHRDRLEILILTLSDESLQTAVWWSQYDQAKANIMILFTWPAKQQLSTAFAQLEDNIWNKEWIKKALESIWSIAQQQMASGTIDEVDFNEIVRQICEIVFYYDVESATCGTDDISIEWNTEGSWSENTQNTVENWSSWNNEKWRFSGIVKRVIIWVIILVLIFIVIVIIFALKARNAAHEEDDEDE